jgi:hypothetical protein
MTLSFRGCSDNGVFKEEVKEQWME